MNGKKSVAEEASTAPTVLQLTFYLDSDRLRLYHHVADHQFASILPSIHSLHLADAAIQHIRTHLSEYSAFHVFLHISVHCYLHGSGEESRDSISAGPEVVDHHLSGRSQLLAILQPDNGGLQPGIGDVNGAVELSPVAF